jgi:hypothetical protein
LHVHISRASCSWFNVFHDVVKRLNGVIGRMIVEGGGAAGRDSVGKLKMVATGIGSGWRDWGIVALG